MQREDDLNGRSRYKQVCYSLVILIAGFLFCLIIMALAYFTYQSAVGRTDFCTLWTDIPGRLAIFTTCYYVAGICGWFPIPDRCRLNWLPKPFILWRLKSWRNLFRSLYFLLPFSHLINRIRINARNGPEMSHLREDSRERFYDCLPIVRQLSEPTPIVYPDTPTDRAVVRSEEFAKNESPEINNSQEESFMSFDSPVCGYIVPMAKGKSSKPHYVPDSSISISESSNDPDGAFGSVGDVNDPSGSVSNTGGAANYEARVVNKQQDEIDTPSRTPDIDVLLPDYPRFPWGLLKHSKGVPPSARVLHRKNLRIERREVEKYARIQRREVEKKRKESSREAESPNEMQAENEWVTDNDEFDPIANRPLRRPALPPRRRIRSRGRFRTTSGNTRKPSQFRIQTHRRAASEMSHQTQSVASPSSMPKSAEMKTDDENTKCCEDSPNLQYKLDCIKRTLMRFGQDPQTRTGVPGMLEFRQNIDTAERETTETADRNIGSSAISASSTRTKLTEKPDVKISFTLPKDESKEDNSDSSPKDV